MFNSLALLAVIWLSMEPSPEGFGVTSTLPRIWPNFWDSCGPKPLNGLRAAETEDTPFAGGPAVEVERQVSGPGQVMRRLPENLGMFRLQGAEDVM